MAVESTGDSADGVVRARLVTCAGGGAAPRPVRGRRAGSDSEKRAEPERRGGRGDVRPTPFILSGGGGGGGGGGPAHSQPRHQALGEGKWREFEPASYSLRPRSVTGGDQGMVAPPTNPARPGPDPGDPARASAEGRGAGRPEPRVAARAGCRSDPIDSDLHGQAPLVAITAPRRSRPHIHLKLGPGTAATRFTVAANLGFGLNRDARCNFNTDEQSK